MHRPSNHSCDLPGLTSIVYSFLPHVVKSKSSSFLTEWYRHHLVSIHLLIAAGYGDQLGLAWYLAFIMPLCFKSSFYKYCQRSLDRQNVCMIYHQHSQEIKLTHQRKGQGAHKGSLQGLRSLSLWLCVNTVPLALSSFRISQFRCTLVIPAFSLDSLHIRSCQSSPQKSLWPLFSSNPPESITHDTTGQKGVVPLEGSWSVGRGGVWGV